MHGTLSLSVRVERRACVFVLVVSQSAHVVQHRPVPSTTPDPVTTTSPLPDGPRAEPLISPVALRNWLKRIKVVLSFSTDCGLLDTVFLCSSWVAVDILSSFIVYRKFWFIWLRSISSYYLSIGCKHLSSFSFMAYSRSLTMSCCTWTNMTSTYIIVNNNRYFFRFLFTNN